MAEQQQQSGSKDNTVSQDTTANNADAKSDDSSASESSGGGGRGTGTFGVGFSADYSRRYGFSAEASSKISVRMESRPPPIAMLQLAGLPDALIKEIRSRTPPHPETEGNLTSDDYKTEDLS